MNQNLDYQLYDVIKENHEDASFYKYNLLESTDKVNLSRDLLDRVYTNITEKYLQIDFGNIPKSAGIISNMKEYDNLVKSLDLLQDIAKSSKQNIPDINTITTSLSYLDKFKNDFHMGFVKNNDSIKIVYNILTMAVYSSTSLLISTLIHYINTENNDSVQVVLDRQYGKSQQYLLLQTLESFNNQVKAGTFEKMLKTSQTKVINEAFAVSVAAITIAGLIAAFKIIPVIKELVYLFYLGRMKLSDSIAIQAELVSANINTIGGTHSSDSRTIRIQKWVADKLVSLSNLFAINYEKNEKRASNEAKSKLTSNDVVLF